MTIDTEPMYYLTAATMAYPHGRVLRTTDDGTLAVYDQQQWRDLDHATEVPASAHAITDREASELTG